MTPTPQVHRRVLALALAGLTLLLGCTRHHAAVLPVMPDSPRATFALTHPRGRPDVLVILALSGGGSRAAVFSTAVMFRLQQLGLLQEVDALSSVSGGSLPAAYYAVSRDPSSTSAAPVWEEAEVKPLMQENFIRQWLLRWFLPWNFVRYWTPYYTRTDIMAGVFAHDLFAAGFTGSGLALRDLNPERPYLILNATNATSNPEAKEVFGPFTFTAEDFKDKLNRDDLDSVRVADAVMTSAAFPAVFNYANLRDRRTTKTRFAHLFDGGNFDNLGLTSAARVIEDNWSQGRQFRHMAVILIDSFTAPRGVPANQRDPRWPFGYVVDTNFLDSYDALLKANRTNLLAWFYHTILNKYSTVDAAGHVIEKPQFCHLTWEPENSPQPKDPSEVIPAVPAALRRKLNRIKTDFRIAEKDARRLDQAATLLVDDNTCLLGLHRMWGPDPHIRPPL